MSDDIDLSKKEIEDLVVEIGNKIQALSKAKGREREQLVSYIEDRLDRIRDSFQAFKAELHDVAPENAGVYQNLKKKFDTQIRKLNSDFEWAKREADHDELVGGVRTGHFDAHTATAQELVTRTRVQYDDADASIIRSKQIVADTEVVGAATINMLGKQGEQLKKIDQNLDEIQDNLKRADKLLRAFIRRMATDRLILCWLFLIVVGVIVIIAYQAVKKSRKH
eukprot:c11063_g1_i2.p1 GENE.c11063_g1_i2~~c11063_g1_i2.p1  ORF type:complete len:242 (-),score=42.09 c11063_g1_i2:260-928(-)